MTNRTTTTIKVVHRLRKARSVPSPRRAPTRSATHGSPVSLSPLSELCSKGSARNSVMIATGLALFVGTASHVATTIGERVRAAARAEDDDGLRGCGAKSKHGAVQRRSACTSGSARSVSRNVVVVAAAYDDRSTTAWPTCGSPPPAPLRGPRRDPGVPSRRPRRGAAAGASPIQAPDGRGFTAPANAATRCGCRRARRSAPLGGR